MFVFHEASQLGLLLLTWTNLNPNMDELLHPLQSVGSTNFSIPKLQPLKFRSE